MTCSNQSKSFKIKLHFIVIKNFNQSNHLPHLITLLINGQFVLVDNSSKIYIMNH